MSELPKRPLGVDGGPRDGPPRYARSFSVPGPTERYGLDQPARRFLVWASVAVSAVLVLVG
jgi:hypothetical protein